jgi:hypothetical protein
MQLYNVDLNGQFKAPIKNIDFVIYNRSGATLAMYIESLNCTTPPSDRSATIETDKLRTQRSKRGVTWLLYEDPVEAQSTPVVAFTVGTTPEWVNPPQ